MPTTIWEAHLRNGCPEPLQKCRRACHPASGQETVRRISTQQYPCPHGQQRNVSRSRLLSKTLELQRENRNVAACLRKQPWSASCAFQKQQPMGASVGQVGFQTFAGWRAHRLRVKRLHCAEGFPALLKSDVGVAPRTYAFPCLIQI